jgi:hypothetical protein
MMSPSVGQTVLPEKGLGTNSSLKKAIILLMEIN